MQVKQVERWMRLALGALVLLFVGIIYAWAILKTPFAGEFGWDAGQLSMNYTLTIVAFCIGGFIAGMLSNKTSPRLRLIVAAVLLFGGFFLASRLTGDNIWLLYLTYGVMSGTGVGFAYTTIIGLTNAWFPDKKGLCSGVLLMSFGLTSLIIGNLADLMIKTESIGWRTTFLVLAIAEGVVLVVASLFIKAPAEGTIFPLAKSSEKPKSSGGSSRRSATSAKLSKSRKAAEVPREYTVTEMIARPSFWLLFVFLVLLAAVGSAAIALAADILLGLGIEAPATIIGIISIFNGLGRLASGALFDKFGLRNTQYLISALAISAPLTVMLAVYMNSMPIGVFGLCLCYFSYGFAPTTSSVFTSSFYGMKNFTQNFSVMNLLLVPAPFAAVMAGTVYAGTGSFLVPFMILAACSFLGLALNLMINQA